MSSPPAEPPAEPPPAVSTGDDSVLAFLRDNISFVVAAGAAVVVGARLFAVARYDVTTAMALLSFAGTSSVIAGLVLTTVLPLLALILLMLAAALWLQHRSGNVVVFAAAAASLAVAVMPAVVLLPFVGIFTLVFVSVVRSRRATAEPEPAAARRAQALDWREAALGALLGAVVMFVFILNTTPWMSAEEFDVTDKDRKTHVVAYVLQREAEELVVLDQGERTIDRYAATSVSERRGLLGGRAVLGQAVGARRPVRPRRPQVPHDVTLEDMDVGFRRLCPPDPVSEGAWRLRRSGRRSPA